jgi:putative ABC transport system substrate-binding protein
MKRREFIALLGGTTAAWPYVARAQQQMPIIGFLSGRSPGESAGLVESFRTGLRQIGFVEGQDVLIAFRWAEGRYDRLPELAAELVGLHVGVLFAAGGSPSALAAKAATSTTSVVFVGSDPVNIGLVASFNHPGANVTGISNMANDLPSKSTALLKQLAPAVDVIAYLINPSNLVAEANAKQAELAASSLGIQLQVIHARTLDDLDETFATLKKQRIGALVVMADAFFDSQRERVVALSVKHGVVGCYPWREYVLAGGIMSYGTSLSDSYRQAGIYAGRILRGERPSDLPVMQPTKIELALNLKTAKAMGITIPPTLLAIADEVIE